MFLLSILSESIISYISTLVTMNIRWEEYIEIEAASMWDFMAERDWERPVGINTAYPDGISASWEAEMTWQKTAPRCNAALADTNIDMHESYCPVVVEIRQCLTWFYLRWKMHHSVDEGVAWAKNKATSTCYEAVWIDWRCPLESVLEANTRSPHEWIAYALGW